MYMMKLTTIQYQDIADMIARTIAPVSCTT